LTSRFVRRALHGGQTRSQVSDFLSLIADPFEIRDGLDDGHDHPQVARRGRAQREDAAALLVDRHLHAVDLVVIGRHRFTQPAVAFDQGEDRFVKLLFDETAHLQYLSAHLFQVFVEAPGNMVAEIGRFHDIYLRAKRESRHANTLVRLHPIATHVNNLRNICDVMRAPRRVFQIGRFAATENDR